MWGNIAAQQKSYGGNTVAIHNAIFEKAMKLNCQPAQYKKKNIKTTKTSLKKKSCRQIL
jgi:hypothetical protein